MEPAAPKEAPTSMDTIENDEQGDTPYDSTGAAIRGGSRESRGSRMSAPGGGGMMLSGDVIQVDMAVLADVLGELLFSLLLLLS